MHPILFHITLFGHPMAAHSYGVLLMLAFLVAVTWAYRTAVREQQSGAANAIEPNDVLDASVWMILAGVVGARALFIALDWETYRGHPSTWFQIWNGGISFHGALLGGLIALIAYCRLRRISILHFTDLVSAPAMVGYAIGRVGCFFNGCCYGAPTNLPWGVRFDDDGHWTVPSHPTQLYSTLLSLVFLAILSRLYARRAFDGQVFCWYIVLSAIERFVMEIWRAGVTSTGGALGLTDVQILCVVLVALSGIGLVVLRRRARGNAAADAPAIGVTHA